MKSKIIHIPHSSVFIPDNFIIDFLLNKKELSKELDIMTDNFSYYLVNEIDDVEYVKFNYSRLICDVERFNDDTEIMNTIGMGVFYTKTHELKELKKINHKEFINKIYNEHHEKLYTKTKQLLNVNEKVLIFDIHSYSNEKLPYEISETDKRPDICIGFNDYHINDKILRDIEHILDDFNYSYEFNIPFSGSIVPKEYYNENENVLSVMIEINKKLYMDNNSINKKKFKNLKKNLKYLIENINI